MAIELLNQEENLKLAAVEVENMKKEYTEVRERFRKAVIRFTQFRFKTVKYFIYQEWDEQEKKFLVTMYIKVRFCDEKEINVDFASRTPSGKKYGQDIISAEDPSIAYWKGITQAEYEEGKNKIMEELNIQEKQQIILTR